jgi:hypothetical protein
MDPAKPEFQTSRLKVASALRLHKLATLHGSSLVRFLGHIESSQWNTIAAKLKALLNLA